ncbi:MAG: glycine betaine ABC transporter substrate-binding protein [Trueperaceae bacterium]|nr:glycine betaine ABC transporter substrate-binding protein [Trueperaceae bacterium]
MTPAARLRAAPLGLLAVLALALPVGALAQDTLRIAHVDWSSSVASAHVVAEAISRQLDVRVELSEHPVGDAWRAVAEGEADAFLSAWLPSTHAPYWAEHEDDLVDLGPNLEGTRTGLMVPDVAGSRQVGRGGQRGVNEADIVSIADLEGRAERYGGRIIGIDPGAGVMRQTEAAMEAYGLQDWELVVTGSEAAMIHRLREAIRRGDDIVVTGWVPLWVHARWQLRFLEDPEGVYGGREAIHTVVRPGLADDMPAAADALDAFAWSAEEMQQMMLWMVEGESAFPRDAARRWLDANASRAAAWFE